MTPADHAEKLAHVTQTTAYASAAGGVIFGLTASEWGAIAAIISGIVAILSFIANQFWKWQHFKLAKEGGSGRQTD